MEFKGTKGEWFLDSHANTVSTKEEVDGDIICDAPECFSESMENWEANAKLIAAAPDLLNALLESQKFIVELQTNASGQAYYKSMKALEKALK